MIYHSRDNTYKQFFYYRGFLLFMLHISTVIFLLRFLHLCIVSIKLLTLAANMLAVELKLCLRFWINRLLHISPRVHLTVIRHCVRWCMYNFCNTISMTKIVDILCHELRTKEINIITWVKSTFPNAFHILISVSPKWIPVGPARICCLRPLLGIVVAVHFL